MSYYYTDLIDLKTLADLVDDYDERTAALKAAIKAGTPEAKLAREFRQVEILKDRILEIRRTLRAN